MEQLIDKVLNKMSEIEYGWVDKNGDIHRRAKKSFFLKNYHFQSIDETLGYKVGTCWEQVELARYYLEKEDIHVDSYFIMYDDESKIARHTIAIASLYGKYWWIENAWKARGNYSFFDSPEDILAKVIELYPRMYKIENFDYEKIEIYKYSKPIAGLSFEDFTEYCRNQDEVVLDGYYIRKLKDFYIEAPKGLLVNDVEKKDDYTIVSSHYIKDCDVNYITDIVDNEGLENIEKSVEKEMMYRDAPACYLVFSDTHIFEKREKIFSKDRYEVFSEESWMIYTDFYKLKEMNFSTKHEIEIEKTVDMDIIADVFERSFKSSSNEIDFEGYYKMFERYIGPSNYNYEHSFYLIKSDLDVCGCVMTLCDDKIFGIYDFGIMEKSRSDEIEKIVLQKILKRCIKMDKKVAFIQTKNDIHKENLYKDFGFKKVLETAYYKRKDNKKQKTIFGI